MGYLNFSPIAELSMRPNFKNSQKSEAAKKLSLIVNHSFFFFDSLCSFESFHFPLYFLLNFCGIRLLFFDFFKSFVN